MDFKGRMGPALFALGVGVRSVLIGGLAFLALHLAIDRGYYATALVLVGLALLIGADLARSASGADRVLAVFIDGLLAEGAERPARAPGAAARLTESIERALQRIWRTRAERQSRIDYLQSLADTVSSALIAVDAQGRIEWSNVAARRTLDVAALPQVVAGLSHIAPGRSAVVSYPDGARLVTVSGFRAPGGGERRLIALQRLAGELDAVELKAWQDLSRILSHEMMNSLTPICSLAESSAAMLRDAKAGPEVAEAVEVIARRSAGLMSFVDRYRQLAELPPPARSATPAEGFVRRIEPLMSALARDRGVEWAARCEEGLTLDVDVELLEQAVINLVKNAFDAVAGRKDARVEVEVLREAGAPVIAVRDNGPGLAEGDLEAAFVPFFTRKAGGSGIGLTLARQIAIAHGGRLEHRPVEPHGATFRLVLPEGGS